jgi:hypothetical protein
MQKVFNQSWRVNKETKKLKLSEIFFCANVLHITIASLFRNQKTKFMTLKKYYSELNKTNTITCNRCGGSGRLPQYNHVENGICFKCRGEGVVKNFSK